MRTVGSRRIKVVAGDTLLVNGYELSADILKEIIAPDKRLLWAFVRNGAHDVQPVPYDESRVIWLAEEDIVRKDNEQV